MSCGFSLFDLNACSPQVDTSNTCPTWDFSNFCDTLPKADTKKKVKKVKNAKPAKEEPIEEEIDFSEFKKFLEKYKECETKEEPKAETKPAECSLPACNWSPCSAPSYNCCAPSFNYCTPTWGPGVYSGCNTNFAALLWPNDPCNRRKLTAFTLLY